MRHTDAEIRTSAQIEREELEYYDDLVKQEKAKQRDAQLDPRELKDFLNGIREKRD
jgi:hypothetical protein